jgi:MYXO-CTERM domain-containing protein
MVTSWYNQTRALPFIASCFVCSVALADDVQWFNNPLEQDWWDAVGSVTTIDFTGHEHFEPLSDQYAHLGITFSGTVHFMESGLFINDGWGMRGFMGAWIHFDNPINWIAADFPGNLGYELYSGDELIYTSFEFGVGGTGNFGGLISSKPFDRVFIWEQPGTDGFFIPHIDDLHFGAFAVPAPGALGVVGLALLVHRRRRRW